MAETGSNFQLIADVARRLEDLEVEALSSEQDAQYKKELEQWLVAAGRSVQSARGGHIHANYVHKLPNGKRLLIRLSLDVIEV